MPESVARQMMRAALKPYCTDVRELMLGAERIETLERAIDSFLHAERAVRRESVATVQQVATLRQAREALVQAIHWSPID